MWTPAGNDRFTWEHEADGAGVTDPDRPRRLFDPGDGSLIEAEGPTLVRYPAAYIEHGAIWNESGQCWVVQNSGWDFRDETDFWALLEQASDDAHPIWETARKPKQPAVQETPKAVPVPKVQPAKTEDPQD